MATNAANKPRAGNKRKMGEVAVPLQGQDEKVLHLELENEFLEGRVKILETDARNYRTKIESLLKALRETTEKLETENVRYKKFEDECSWRAKSQDFLLKNNKELRERCKATGVKHENSEKSVT